MAAFFAISSEGRAGFAEGRYSKVERSRTRRWSLPAESVPWVADLLVEALAGFIAEPATLEKLVEDWGKPAACDALRKVGRDVGEDIDADEVGEAKGPGARPADGGAGERVDFLDGEPLLEHEVGGAEHDGDTDAICDEVGRVVREDDLFAEAEIGER